VDAEGHGSEITWDLCRQQIYFRRPVRHVRRLSKRRPQPTERSHVKLRYPRLANPEARGDHPEVNAFEVVPPNDTRFSFRQTPDGAPHSRSLVTFLHLLVRRRLFVRERQDHVLRQVPESHHHVALGARPHASRKPVERSKLVEDGPVDTNACVSLELGPSTGDLPQCVEKAHRPRSHEVFSENAGRNPAQHARSDLVNEWHVERDLFAREGQQMKNRSAYWLGNVRAARLARGHARVCRRSPVIGSPLAVLGDEPAHRHAVGFRCVLVWIELMKDA
jgi:hypothetical protein